MNKDNSIVVSVCMSVYNNERYVGKALDSILMQKTDFDYEIVVCDDCSQDNTVKILKEYQEKYPNIIKILENKENMGVMKIMSKIFRNTKGKYIAMLDSDDYWKDPFKLQKQFEFLESNPEYMLSHHGVDLIDENDELLKGGAVFQPKDHDEEEMMMGQAATRMATLFFRNMNFNFLKPIIDARYNLVTLTHILGFYGKAKYQENVENSVYRVHSGGNHSGRSKVYQTIKGFQTRMVLKSNLPTLELQEKMQKSNEQRLLESLFVAFREKDKDTYKKLIEYIKEEQEISTVPFLAKHSVDVVKRIGYKVLKKLTGRS